MDRGVLVCDRRQFQRACLAALLWFPTRGLLAKEVVQSDALASLVLANNALALKLLGEFGARSKDENQFFSPFSIESALAIALEGARGATASEMAQALQFPKREGDEGRATGQLADLRSGFHALSAQLDLGSSDSQRTKRGVRLRSANSLWVDQSFPLSQEYQQTVRQNYGASETFACDFQRAGEAQRNRINQWVSERTAQKIQELIPSGAITPLTRLVIANAIYFKGLWAKPFDPKATRPAEFTLGGGRKVQADLMHARNFDDGAYAAFHADGSLIETPKTLPAGASAEQGYPSGAGFQVVELPYESSAPTDAAAADANAATRGRGPQRSNGAHSSGDGLSMLVFLPRRPDGLSDLVSSLTADKIAAVAQQLEARPFHVALPKFKVEARYALNEPLQSLGMRKAFSSTEADFSGLTDSRDPEHELYISAVFHKAFVEVNEEGTEAAAATGVVMATRAAAVGDPPFVPSFTADHPFLFAIRHRQTGLILFIGQVEKPSK